jgi:hypothetical protein
VRTSSHHRPLGQHKQTRLSKAQVQVQVQEPPQVQAQALVGEAEAHFCHSPRGPQPPMQTVLRLSSKKD